MITNLDERHVWEQLERLGCDPLASLQWVAHFSSSVQAKRRNNSKPLECWHWGNIYSHRVSKDIPCFLPCHTLWWPRNKAGPMRAWQTCSNTGRMGQAGLAITLSRPPHDCGMSGWWNECLVAFRGHCPFRQYIQSKSAKYSSKLWAACDAQ